jgi:phenylalanyl-tRNA synthetase beta chain
MKYPLKWLSEYIDLPKDLKVFTDKMSMIGHMLDKTIETDSDTVIDLELRGNRADCYGILGIARESHASFGGRFDIPKLPALPEAKGYADFAIEAHSPAVLRFHSVIIRNVSVGPSPEWMQERLRNYGMEPINNLVDITNYVMLESGMPLHAFDLKRIGGKKLILRAAKEKESFVSFDGGTITLSPEDVVFANEAGKVLGLVGIVGEKGSGVHDDTTDILLECAAYDQATIRKTVYRYNVLTEAGLRHTHDLDASLCDFALPRAAALVLEHAAGQGGATIEGRDDYHPNPRSAPVIEFDPNEVTRLGGVSVDTDRQEEILQRLQFGVDRKGNQLIVTAPLFRTDIKASEDIVEEVLRIYGYENIPVRTLASAVPLPVEQREVLLEEGSRDVMRALGLDEIITVPFYHGDMFDRIRDPLKDRAIAIVNPPTALHTHMRTTMFVEHLEVAHKIQARGDETMAFYEVGKLYFRKEGTEAFEPHKPEFPYIEKRVITALFAAKDGSWDYYRVKGVLEQYFEEMGVENVTFSRKDGFPYRVSAVAIQNGRELASIGLVNTIISKRIFHLPYDVYGFVIDIDALAGATFSPVSYTPYSAYPAITMDMSVQVPHDIQAGDIASAIRAAGGDILRGVTVADVYDKKDGTRSLLFRLTYQSKDRTLTTDEINGLHGRIAAAVTGSMQVTVTGIPSE